MLDIPQEQRIFNLDKVLDNQTNKNLLIEEINTPTFVQKKFTSSTKGVNSNGASATSTFNVAAVHKDKSESLFHPNLLMEDKEDKLNRWIKKLFLIRQRSMSGESMDL